jgi:hypothetical protein
VVPTTLEAMSDGVLEQFLLPLVCAFIVLPLLAIAGSFVGFIVIGTRAGGCGLEHALLLEAHREPKQHDPAQDAGN